MNDFFDGTSYEGSPLTAEADAANAVRGPLERIGQIVDLALTWQIDLRATSMLLSAYSAEIAMVAQGAGAAFRPGFSEASMTFEGLSVALRVLSESRIAVDNRTLQEITDGVLTGLAQVTQAAELEAS